MLEDLLSSAVEITLSNEERQVLLGRGSRNTGCILNKIEQIISVPLSFQVGKVVIYGKPEETKKAKQIFEGELELVKKVLSRPAVN